MKATIELIFYYCRAKSITKFKLPFKESIEEIKSDEYKFDLPKELFKYNKEKSIFSITLYDNIEEYEFFFYVYKGENKVYIQMDYFFKTVFELIIRSDSKPKIIQFKKELKKLDSLGNKKRERITLINTDYNIVINGQSIDLWDIIAKNYNPPNLTKKFFQISAQLDDKYGKQFIIKRIEENEDQINLNFLKNNKNRLYDFLSDFKVCLQKENFALNYMNLQKKYSDIFNMIPPRLNKDNGYINNFLKDNELTDLNIFFIVYFTKIILNNEGKNNQDFLSAVLERAKTEYMYIESKNNIEIDEKIKILSVYILLYNECETKLNLNSLQIRNFIFSERQNNSIMDKVYKFYENFIESLTEESKIFDYLLQLNSGIGFFKKQKVYTFDLTNPDMIKRHLKSLFPKSLTIYNYNDSEERGIAFCSYHTGGIALNEIYLMSKEKYNNIDFNSINPNISEKESNDIAMNIVLYLFHEFMGHKKFHNSENGTLSPQKIVRNNQLIELKYEKEYKKNDDKKEYILTSNIKNKGDSGHFLELCFNKFNHESIFKLLISLENKGKIINRPDLFVNLNETLEKYVILRKIAKEKKISLELNDNMSIEDEIKYMNTKIDIQKYLEEQTLKEEKKDYNKKKKEKKDNLKSINQENKYYMKHLSNIEIEEENYEEEGEEEEEEKKKNKSEKKMERIIKKFHFKNDEELPINIEKKLKETNLSQKDYKDLNYLYLKFIKLF